MQRTQRRRPSLEFRWSAEAAQRLIELNSGNVDGMDNPGTDDIATIQGDSALTFNVREPLNTSFIGFNTTVAPWDEREDPPGDRPGHRPAADRRQLLSGRVRGRVALHAVQRAVRL